ncbi:MAG: CAP domain-containing protein [Candidatus Doudnabacteria bacterium]|nr:CAP domain-containing protein [bacterium]MDZ4244168.1 CAP domain-containing protein [Candidatus Doudnabacteria bacterium]
MVRNDVEVELFGFDFENSDELPINAPKNTTFAKAVVLLVVLVSSLLLVPWEGSGESSFTSQNLILLLNQEREKNGLGHLQTNPLLEKAAYAKAEDMLENGYFAHTAPDGTKPWDFIKSAGLPYLFAGENLAINYTNAYELTHDLMQSAAHRDNLLSPVFSEIGIAIINGRYQGRDATIIVQMFTHPIE